MMQRPSFLSLTLWRQTWGEHFRANGNGHDIESTNEGQDMSNLLMLGRWNDKDILTAWSLG